MIRRCFAVVVIAVVSVLLVLPGINHTAIGNVMATAIALAAWSFAALYVSRSNWRSTVAGRALLYMMAAFASFATQVTVSAWTGSTYPFRDEIRGVLYTVLALTVANMVWTLYRIQARRQ